MPLTSSFGLDPALQMRFREIGYVFNPSIVELSRSLFVDSFDVSLPADGKRKDDLSYGDHGRQKLDICFPPGRNSPVVLFVPGGGMTGGDKSFYAHIPAYFARKGFVGAAMNYRLAPEFLFPKGAEDVAAAIDWLVENVEHYGGDPRRIFLMGQSAGAIHAASAIFDKRCRPKHYDVLKLAVLMSGVYKITPNHDGGNINLYFGNAAAELQDRSPVNHVAEAALPVILTVAELEPAFFGLSAGALMEALSARDGHAPELVWLRGHNHLSPVLNLGSRGDELGDAIVDAMRPYV